MSGDGEGATFEGVHEMEVWPGGRGGGADDDALFFGAVAFTELFDFVAALGGGFGGLVVVASGGDGDGDFLPLGSFELAALEGVPFFLVSLDEVRGFLVGPWEGLSFLGPVWR